MASLKTVQAMLDRAIASTGVRGFTAEDLQDLIYSLVDVGGILWGTDKSQIVTPSFAVFNAYNGALNTKGVSPNVSGEFVIDEGAEGQYSITAVYSVISPVDAEVTVAATLNGTVTQFQAPVDLAAAKKQQLVLIGAGNVSTGNRIGVKIKSDVSTTLAVSSSQFRVDR